MHVLGIDEAGRGPLLGPLVVAGVVVHTGRLSLLEAVGVRDSKKLTRKIRERLYKRIMELADAVVIVEVPPEAIDTVNLNQLERDTIAHIVHRVLRLGFNVAKTYIDAVGEPSRLIAVVRRTGYAGDVVVEPRADEKYVAVSAASIVAKVVRDWAIDQLRRLYGVRGSGYPTDPETIEWVREAYARQPSNPPPFIRRSWSTLKSIAPGWYKPKKGEETRQRSLLDYLRRG